MENLLRAKGLWSLVECGFEEPIERTLLTDAQQGLLNNTRTKYHQVKYYLFEAIDRTVFEQILDRRTSKVVWDSLKNFFGGNEKVNKSLRNSLRRDFEILKMKKGESIIDYFARVMVIANKLRSNGEDMLDYKIVEKILRTLTKQFTCVVVFIKESKDTDNISIDELQSSLVMHEQKFNRVHKEDDDQALKVEEIARYGRGRGKEPSRGRGRGRGRYNVDKATIECFKCQNLGKYQFECPKWNKEANYIELEDDELLLMAYVDDSERKRRDVWFIDSGCSNHMCRDKDMFSSLDLTFSHLVKLGNNNRMQVSGKRVVKLELGGIVYGIGDVYFIPDLKNNLLSVGQLQEKGLTVLFQGKLCNIYHPQRGLIAQNEKSANRMFTIVSKSPSVNNVQQERSKEVNCFHTNGDDLSKLWHQRYGHLS
ncbi:uncharacterized protein LOC124920363 [Impatiens glandulifera]|uniref:uncharacterized protein LOC124920363 n=1 Tax=Impatiens glandulifera TaxID=253017 RepID=UPI001FB14684|nr:uncharacterized protein LOC124920363 [Impatiens glandulifera]